MICAACGKTGASLKLCAACNDVRYCDASCQKNNRKAHRKECKQKALELKALIEVTSALESLSITVPTDLDNPNSDLWKSPPRQECPICMLPLPLAPCESNYMTCCGKIVCGGCMLKNEETIKDNLIAHRVNAPLEQTCPFCREKNPSAMKEAMERAKKRMELNDSEAFLSMSRSFIVGDGVPKDVWKGFQYLVRAAELGNANAYFQLAHCKYGKQIDSYKKEYKELLQLAAMGGVAEARHRLGSLEYENCRFDLALWHWQISAGAGFEDSLHCIKVAYKEGHASKADFAKFLRAYQAALEELKSEERDVFLKERGAA